MLVLCEGKRKKTLLSGAQCKRTWANQEEKTVYRH